MAIDALPKTRTHGGLGTSRKWRPTSLRISGDKEAWPSCCENGACAARQARGFRDSR